MSTIVQKPGSLSLLGNIADIIAASGTTVAFKIILGGTTILEENHSPDNNGRVQIKLRDILLPFFSISVPDSNAFEQTGAVRSFTFDIDGVASTHIVILGGVEASIDAGTFLKANWLTWQPQQKNVQYADPEWLSYYAAIDSKVKLKVYFKSKDPVTIDLASLSAGKMYSLNLNFRRLSGLVDGQPVYVDTWTEDSSGTRLSFVQRYVLTADQHEYDDLFVFVNSLGGLDTVRFTGTREEENEFEISSALINDEQTIDYDVDSIYFFVKNTGYLKSTRIRAWVNEFLNSSTRYYLTGDGLQSITVSEPEAKVDLSDPETFYYEFRFALSRQTRFLNFERATQLPENVEIIDPDTEVFFLAPRLIEFPTGTLSNLLLFPVQDPFVQKWKQVSYSAIRSDIIAAVSDAGFVTGGDVGSYIDLSAYVKAEEILPLLERFHLHDNKDLLDVLSYSTKGYLFVSGKKIAAGYADEADLAADSLALGGILAEEYYHTGNANRADVSWAMLDGTFHGYAGSPNFVSGFPGGTGWAIWLKDFLNSAGVIEKKSIAEFDELTIRGTMRVYEMIISQLLGENGTRLTTDMMKVYSIDVAAKTIYLDTEGGLLYNPFRVGDIIAVQRFAGLTGDGNITRSYEFVVTGIGVGSSGEDRLDWLTYDSFVGDTSLVQPRDVLVRVDSLTNSDRKGLIKHTSVEPESPYIDILYGMKTDPDNAVRLRLGKLSGIIDYFWGQLKGYGLFSENAYLHGDFRLRTGDDVRTLFEVVGGMLRSAMQSITYNITEEDNYFTNATFTRDKEGWECDDSDIDLYGDGDVLIDMGMNFLSDKRTISEVVEYDGRQMLRLQEGFIRQLNWLIKKPEAGNVMYLNFRYKCVTAGGLTVGFEGADDESDFAISEVALDVNDEYAIFEITGTWDGTGDFYLSFTGDIYIELLSFANRPLDDYKRQVSTLFEQTDKYIRAVATDINSLENYINQAGWVTTAEGHDLWATKTIFNYLQDRVYEHFSNFHVTPEQISGIVTSVDTINNIIAEGGWITESKGHTLWASTSEVDALGNKITSHMGSFHVTALEISGLVERIGNTEGDLNTLSNYVRYQAGWVTTADGNDLWASKERINELTGEIELWKSEIEQTADRLTLSVGSGFGEMLYTDPEFKAGMNGTSVYNSSTTKPGYERVEAASDVPTCSDYMMKLVYTYGTEVLPGLGGFGWGTQSKANAVFKAHIIAKIPVGYTLNFDSNAYGTGGSATWLTSQEGTGDWATYTCKIRCGTLGTFSTTNFFYLQGKKPVVQYSVNGTAWYSYYTNQMKYLRIYNETTGGYGSTIYLETTPDANKLIWYIASATVYELGVSEDIVSQINMTPGEIKIQAGKISLEGLVTANDHFKILPDGSMEAAAGTFAGYIRTPFVKLQESDATLTGTRTYKLNTNLNVYNDGSISSSMPVYIVLPNNEKYIGSIVNVLDFRFAPFTYASLAWSTIIKTESGVGIAGTHKTSEINTSVTDPTEINVLSGVLQFLGVPGYHSNEKVKWIVLNYH